MYDKEYPYPIPMHSAKRGQLIGYNMGLQIEAYKNVIIGPVDGNISIKAVINAKGVQKVIMCV